jgi:hypothetical protein
MNMQIRYFTVPLVLLLGVKLFGALKRCLTPFVGHCPNIYATQSPGWPPADEPETGGSFALQH